jgi:thiamine-phosphate pyrophosphorylase
VTLAAGCDGVHVGQEDMTVADARRLLGPGAIIGLSIKTVAQASAAPLDLIDYAGIGGVYGTTSKSNTSKPIGPAGLKRIIEEFHRRKPAFLTCGIAGINESNATEVIAAGVDGISVISALSLAPDPQGAARRLREIIDTALAKRGRA